MPLCLGVHKAAFGKRMLWLECRLRAKHTGRHYDAKRNFYWDELFYWDEFDRSQPDKIVKPKRVRKKAEVRDILTVPGAKWEVLAQLRKENKWAWLDSPGAVVAAAKQQTFEFDPNPPYYGEW